jgi:hypothetical protein
MIGAQMVHLRADPALHIKQDYKKMVDYHGGQ